MTLTPPPSATSTPSSEQVPQITEELNAAFKQAVVDPLDQQITRLLDSIGPRMTAAALGLKDSRMLLRWQAGDTPRGSTVPHRADALAEVVYAVTAVYPGSVAASFLRSGQPALDGDSPLLLLRGAADDDLPALQDRLRAAVRAFLEG